MAQAGTVSLKLPQPVMIPAAHFHRFRHRPAGTSVYSAPTRIKPAPVRDIPVLIGGSGEKRTLPLVGRHAHIWHSFPLIGNPIVRRTWAAWPAESRRREVATRIAALDMTS